MHEYNVWLVRPMSPSIIYIPSENINCGKMRRDAEFLRCAMVSLIMYT